MRWLTLTATRSMRICSSRCPAGNPTASLPSDPRPSFPTDLYDGGNQHIMVRSSWATTGTLFSYYCPNTLIDHEMEILRPLRHILQQ